MLIIATTKKNQVWQHSYTRVRRPLIIARLTQRTPCPGIWSECRSYVPEVTGSSQMRTPGIEHVISFCFFLLRGGRGGGKQFDANYLTILGAAQTKTANRNGGVRRGEGRAGLCRRPGDAGSRRCSSGCSVRGGGAIRAGYEPVVPSSLIISSMI